MFEHPNADQLVVKARLVQITVVADFDAAPVIQPGLADALISQIGLGLAERDPVRLHAVIARGVDDQPSPAAADVEQSLVAAQPQLAADVIEGGL